MTTTTYISTDHTKEYKEATKDDCYNDHALYFGLRCGIVDMIKELQKYEKKEAFAIPQQEFVTHLIDTFDDLLADVIQPKETQLEKALEHHEQRNNI